MIHTTKIYLVTKCYNDPNKVYIGKTKTSRKSAHKCKFGNQITYDYIDEILGLNKNDWKSLETYWIEQFIQWGFEVLNKNKGGGGPETHSEKTRQKLAFGRKGKKHSNKSKLKISKANKGKLMSSQHKQKISKKLLGIKRTKETKIKMSEIKKGKIPYIYTAEQLEKRSQLMKNKWFNNPKYRIKKVDNLKPVIQFTKNNIFEKEWPSATEAIKFFGKKCTAMISECCNGKRKTAYGYFWKFK